LLHECNGKTFSSPNFLEMPKPSGAIDPTFLIGGWLRVSFGEDRRLNSLDPCLTLEKLAMKKSLIALAAVAATGAAFAQSTVTLFGTFDPSFANAKTTYGDGKSVSQNLIRNNSQGTSQVTVKGVEDLGGGLKASFLLENDFDAGKDGTANIGSKGGEQYLAIEGGFGKVALGAANTPTLFTQSSANPFSTKIGGGFGVTNTSHVRNNNSMVYTAPVFSGVTLMAAYANQTKVDVNTYTSAPALDTAKNQQNQVTTGAITDIGLLYANGPLSAGISAYSVAAINGSAAAATASKNTQTNAYVSYDFGVAKIGAGFYTEKQDVTGAALASGANTYNYSVASIDSTAFNVSAAVPLSTSLSLLGNYVKKNDKTALNLDRTVAAIGLKYTLSARTSMYARYVEDKIDNVDASKALFAKKTTTALVGVQHNF
jgi:predicted porin